MLSIDLTGKVALVTGSSRGIGRATARRMLLAGADVIINARTLTEELQETERMLAEEFPGKVHIMAGDMGDAAESQRVVRFAFEAGGRLDILVNNAGVLRDNLIGMITEQDVEQTLHNNLMSVIHTTQIAARLMARRKAGSIVNIASYIGTHGNRGQLVYGASKAGVVGATLSASKELAPQGIRVNAIAPGFINTSLIAHLSDEFKAQRVATIAMGRIGQPEDVADVALFLSSDLASYVTGQVIGVDGGMVI